MSVTDAAGLPGRRRRRRDQGIGQPPTSRSSSTTDRRAAAAGVFTGNRVKAAPVLWSQQVLAGGAVRAVVLNSGGANACTGPGGFQDTHQTAEHVAGLLGIGAGEVAVCSTGLIGERLPMDKLLAGVDAAPHRRSADGGPAAADAIRTTDTVPKTCAVQRHRLPVGGMAKGAAMLAPALATMLVVLTTDADAAGGPRPGTARRRRGRPSTGSTPTAACRPTTRCCCWPAARAAITPDPAEFTDAAARRPARDLAAQLQARRRGREQGDHDRGHRRRERGRRRRGRPRRRPLQPAQVRDPRRGPELGPGSRRRRHHQRGVRAGRAQRRDQRRVGVPGRRAGRGQVGGRPAAARGRPSRSTSPPASTRRRSRRPT